MSSTRPWILGLDLRDRTLGAFVFSSWIGGKEPVLGVYVLDAWSAPCPRAEIEADVAAAVARAANELGCRAPDFLLEGAETAELGLARVAKGAAGLILGRAASDPQRAWFRLGPIARKLLRQLPAPIIVVPPTLLQPGKGPVLLATDLGPASVEAIAFARAFAERHDRSLEIVHVGEEFHDQDDDGGRAPAWLKARDDYRAEVEQTVGQWVARHDLTGTPLHIRYGDPVLELASLAESRDAALVVVGSRRLGLVDRVFLSSTASALAGIASCPVAIIPPQE